MKPSTSMKKYVSEDLMACVLFHEGMWNKDEVVESSGPSWTVFPQLFRETSTAASTTSLSGTGDDKQKLPKSFNFVAGAL